MKKNSSHKTLSIVKRISITNIGIFIIACILSIVATLKLNVEYHIDRDAQMMKVYISNTLSSIDNTLKDMGRVSLIAFSDQMVQDILKGTDYSFDEKMENEEYLTKLYSSMISIRDDVRGIYIFNNEDMVFYSDTWNPFLGFDWNVESFFQDVKINSDLSTNISGCHMYVGTLPEGFKYTQTYTKNIFQENNIYLVRPIRSFSPFEVIGYIALRTPILTLQKICSNYLEDNISYIVADENNNVVGLYILHPNNVGRCGHICNASYAVASSCRGKHIGEMLVTDCIKTAANIGFRILQFNAVVESNIHARHLYERVGFIQLGVIPNGFRMKDGHFENICPYYIEL